MIVLFGFLFVTVSSRITGVIGSSSNPISGMTIATLLLTCLIFVLLGWVGPEYRLTALSIAGVVCIASSNGGTTSQDLKTGFLVGATPWKQQVSILVGALISAVFMGLTLLALNQAYTTVSSDPADLPTVKAPAAELKGTEVGPDGKSYRVWWVTNPQPGVLPGKYLVDESGQARYLIDSGIGGRLTKTASGTPIQKFNPPQPRLFATLIDGIMTQKLPWGLVILGAVLAVVMQLAGVSALAFAVGVYLPLSTTLPIFVGGAAPRHRRPRSRAHARGSRDEPRHPDVDRPDRRRLAGRHHHRAPGRLRGLRQEDRFLDSGSARRRARLPGAGHRGLLRDGGGPASPWPCSASGRSWIARRSRQGRASTTSASRKVHRSASRRHQSETFRT